MWHASSGNLGSYALQAFSLGCGSASASLASMLLTRHLVAKLTAAP